MATFRAYEKSNRLNASDSVLVDRSGSATGSTLVSQLLDMDNMVEGALALILTTAERAAIAAALSDIVEDITPQLGGSLDVNGQKIVSVSDGDIDIEPNGTGNVLLGNFTLDADQVVGSGQDNYVLTYDNNAGTISLEEVPSGYLSDVVDDTTPQLGGDLDVNSQSIVSVSNGDITLAPDGTGEVIVDGPMRGNYAVINAQTGTTYTLTGSDAGKIITLSNASAITVTIPQTSTEALAEGFHCVLIQRGAGQVTVAVEGSDSLESSGSADKITGQHSVAYVVKLVAGSPNTWHFSGDITS